MKPEHANGEIQSYQLPSEMKPARDDQKLEVGVEVSGQDGSSACVEEEMNNISSLGSARSSSDNCMQMEETMDKQTKILSGILTVSQEERDQSLDNTFCHLLKESRGNFITVSNQTLKIYLPVMKLSL